MKQTIVVNQKAVVINNIVFSPHADVDPIEKHYVETVLDTISLYDTKVWMIDHDSGEQCTFGDLRQRAIKMSLALKRRDLAPGDIVTFCIKNCIEFGVLSLAVAMADGVINPTNPESTLSE